MRLGQQSEISRMFNTPSMVLTVMSTVVSLLAIIWILCKTRGKDIRIAFLVTMGLYFLNLALTNLRYVLKPWSPPRITISTTCVSLSECLLYYFTFQMRILYLQLMSHTVKDFDVAFKRIIIFRRVLLCAHVFTAGVKVYTEVKLAGNFQSRLAPFGTDFNLVKAVLILSYLVRFFVFLYMSSLFISTINYLITLKVQVLHSKLLKISRFNVFIIVSLYALFVVRSSELLTTGIITIIRLLIDVYHNYPLELIWIIFRFVVMPVQLLLELLMICYMIYFQHQRGKDQNIRDNQRLEIGKLEISSKQQHISAHLH